MTAKLFLKTSSSARERAIFSPGKDGEAGDVGSIVDAAGCSQAEKGPLEARSSFQTEPKTLLGGTPVNPSAGAEGPEFDPSRRLFLQMLGAGLVITVLPDVAPGQRRSGGSGPAATVGARLQINRQGVVTVLTGKVEEGQGARAELTQAAAQELRLPVEQVRMVMADTDLVPNDGITAGSRTTPVNVPSVRKAAATARELLKGLAARAWQVDPKTLTVRDGVITQRQGGQTLSYADLARSQDLAEVFKAQIPADVTLTEVAPGDVLGRSVPRPNGRDLVTGRHQYPRDKTAPNMLYGKILRPPSYGATLLAIDLTPARALPGVRVVREGQFVGCVAPSTFRATEALKAIAKTATWKEVPAPSSQALYAHLKRNARPGRRPREHQRGSLDTGFAEATKVLTESYRVAYVQHAPMEPRSATAQWTGDKLTVWTGTDNPHRVRADLARSLGISHEQVRLIVPDMGGGFGGKHSGEAALEAVRLARAVGQPVAVQWTRTEEFTWAYFRPAALIECKAGVNAEGGLCAWDFTNINAGGSALEPPYAIPHSRARTLGSDGPLRQGAYRGLAATANNFARESFIDELAAAAGRDPLAFRRSHLNNERVRVVLEKAVKEFNWEERSQRITPELGVGLACGTEKNSVVATCAEVAIDRRRGRIKVLHVAEAFECGPIINPANLESQVQGCIAMGLGGILREAMAFDKGAILNPSFGKYQVARFEDMPTIDVHLVANHKIPAAGGGETPLIAIAPAVANAVAAATGVRIRSMPMRPELHRLRVRS